MDLRVWAGLLLFLAWASTSYLKARARRRSGAVSSFGHPILDDFLLLACALILAFALTVALWFFKGNSSHSVKERLVGYPLLLGTGGFLTWFCNRLLRRR